MSAQKKNRVKTRNERRRQKTDNFSESLTRQSEAKTADINYIVSKAKQTGFLPVHRSSEPLAGIPDAESFHEAANIVTRATQMFESLPSPVRQEFDNNPAKLLEALHNPEAKDKLIELGVVEPPPTEPSQPAQEPPADPPVVEQPADPQTTEAQ